jgi:hypothetical protein
MLRQISLEFRVVVLVTSFLVERRVDLVIITRSDRRGGTTVTDEAI